MRRPGHRTIGVAGVVLAAVMGLVVVAVSVVPFGQRHYSALVEHTAGLRVGEEVQVAGVGLGEVRGITLEGRHVRVDFTLDRDVALGSRTTASVKVATLLGTHFLEVAPQGDGDLAGDTIPLARTSVPYNLQDVIEGGTTTLDALDGDTVGSSLEVLAETLRDTPAAARDAIDGVARLSAVAARRSGQMRDLLAATKDVTGDLTRNQDRIIDLLEQSTLVLHELTVRRDAIDQLLSDSQRLAREVSGVLDDTEDDIAPLMRDLTTSLDAMTAQKNELTAAIDGLATMSTYFANATGNGPWLDLKVPLPVPDDIACAVKGASC